MTKGRKRRSNKQEALPPTPEKLSSPREDRLRLRHTSTGSTIALQTCGEGAVGETGLITRRSRAAVALRKASPALRAGDTGKKLERAQAAMRTHTAEEQAGGSEDEVSVDAGKSRKKQGKATGDEDDPLGSSQKRKRKKEKERHRKEEGRRDNGKDKIGQDDEGLLDERSEGGNSDDGSGGDDDYRQPRKKKRRSTEGHGSIGGSQNDPTTDDDLHEASDDSDVNVEDNEEGDEVSLSISGGTLRRYKENMQSMERQIKQLKTDKANKAKEDPTDDTPDRQTMLAIALSVKYSVFKQQKFILGNGSYHKACQAICKSMKTWVGSEIRFGRIYRKHVMRVFNQQRSICAQAAKDIFNSRYT